MSEKVKNVTVRYETALGSFDIDIAAISRPEFEKLGRKHRKTVFDKKTHQKDVEINQETYYPDLYKRIVLGWTGLTEEVRQLVALEQPNGIDPKKVVDFNHDDLINMARSNPQFANYIEQAALNFEELLGAKIVAEREESRLIKFETKNSLTTMKRPNE